MARTLTSIALAALAFTLTGCVSADQYNALKLDRDKLASQLGQSQSECASLKSALAAYQANGQDLMNGQSTSQALIQNQQTQIANLTAQLTDLNKKYEEAIANGANRAGNPLPAALNDALTAFAAQNRDLLDFDASKGIVKFKSDLTFASGDATLTSQARDAIKRFSEILNSQAAERFELVIAGHTDNSKVVNPKTKEAGNFDNWFLSCHRAIAVSEALMADGVSPMRVGAIGYADCRPIASNSTTSGKAQNRRVEVLILPNSIRTAHIASSTIKPSRTSAVSKDENAVLPNK